MTDLCRIIAVMLGRLRLTVDEAIDNYEQIWTAMEARLSRLDRLSPTRKAKIANTKSLDEALKEIIKQNEHSRTDLYMDEARQICFPSLPSRRSILNGGFVSDDLMCRT